ncbi:hypothetical protein C6P40_000530 [Pichia californica]|uniref:Phospholipase C/D domain-containing protein n=1 Tax=Pichia californica TaxID=460514 RepID=A0A9P6WKT7_9ASCO|nr:hypothetical protein C6P40_000530 [[Candida] californica]
MNLTSIQFIFSCIFWILLSTLEFVKCAGVSIHMGVASRVKLQLPISLQSYEKEYYAGSFHPDAFYNCLGESLAAENAHWPPFLKVALEYYNENYQSKGLSNYKLKSFIYGVFTHQVTDVAWHSLQSDQGLMKMISEVEFGGDYQKAHDYLDTIGDFIHLNKEFQNLFDDDHKLLLEFYQNKWKYPIYDIVQIYHLLGFNDITENKLNFCMDRGYSALQAEITTVLTDRSTNHKFNINLENSPLSMVIMNNYFYGGVDQIVTTLSLCIHELTDWFNNEPDSNPWNICKGVFKEHIIKAKNTESNSSALLLLSPSSFLESLTYSTTEINCLMLNDHLYLSSGIPNSKFGSSIKVENYLGEPTIAISAPYEEEGSVYLIPLKEILPYESNKEIYSSNGKILSTKLKSTFKNKNLQFPTKFGSKMLTWSLNELKLLIISLPGISQFKVFWNGSLIAIIKSNYTQSELGVKGIKQWTILSNSYDDINLDGYQDILIGSMFSDDDNNRFQSGLVLVLDGKLFYDIISNRLKHNSDLNIPIIDINSIIFQVYKTPKVLYQDNDYEQFGSSVATTKNKVLIGVNSIGSVAVFEKKSAEYLGLLTDTGFLSHNIESLIERKTSKQSALYAFDNILTGFWGNIEWIIVSSSAYSYNGKCPLCGMAYLYIMENNNFELVTQLVPTKSFEDHIPKNEKFVLCLFSSFMTKITDTIVLIGSSSYDDGKGALFIIDLKDVLMSYIKAREKKEKQQKYTLTNLLYIGKENMGFTNFGYDCIESFFYQENVYIAISLTDYFYSQSTGTRKLTGSVMILRIN